MNDCGPFFILLVITLSMMAFMYTHAIRETKSFRGFVFCCALFSTIVLIRIICGDVFLVPDFTVKTLLGINVAYFFRQTSTALSPVKTVSDFS